MRQTCDAGDAGPVTVVELSSELDLATVPALQRVLDKADPDSGPVILDLREHDFMDCAGAHLLMDTDRRLRETGRSLLLVVVERGPIDRLLSLLGLSHDLVLINSHDKRDRASGWDPTARARPWGTEESAMLPADREELRRRAETRGDRHQPRWRRQFSRASGAIALPTPVVGDPARSTRQGSPERSR